jgi:hypothetical protein
MKTLPNFKEKGALPKSILLKERIRESGFGHGQLAEWAAVCVLGLCERQM